MHHWQVEALATWSWSFACCFPRILLLLALAWSNHAAAPTAAPLEPTTSSTRVTTPEGFQVSLFAAEPEVVQPVAMSFDDRGRLWVVEMLTYADLKTNFDLTLRDRIVILEDTNHDGRMDRRKVFWDQGQRVTSVAVGFGGAWVLAAPQLLFIPDLDADDRPDAPPVVVLDGWDAGPVRHNIVNGLKWGPDGWLYGRHGIQATSRVGKPGTPDHERTPLNCAIWRFHPTRRTFEVVCQGGTNPWGHDWDAYGNLWFINTVIGHLWHGIPGAYYKRMYGEHLAPRRYDLIDQHADHYHWDTGRSWMDSRDGAHGADALGGGHAHSGLMVYLGDNWPARYRNALFTLNFHGRRINRERLEPRGSGLVGRHEPDLIQFEDSWFRGVDLDYGPDGGVYVLDWSDTGECHENDADGVHRETGRIFKITYGQPGPFALTNLARHSSQELVNLQLQPNEWVARHARRVLQERAHSTQIQHPDRALIRTLFERSDDIPVKLRLLWTLHAIGDTDSAWLLARLKDPREHVRAWAITFLTETVPVPDDIPSQLSTHAALETSARVRLALASALQRLSTTNRIALARTLLAHSEDALDHNLPSMLWYGIEPCLTERVAGSDMLLPNCRIPRVRQLIVRRLSERLESHPGDVDAALSWAVDSADPVIHREVLRGLTEGLRGWRKAVPPSAWGRFQQTASALTEASDRQALQELSLLFGDGRTETALRQMVLDANADAETRRTALRQLIDARTSDLEALLEKVLPDPALVGVAARGLSLSPDPASWQSIFRQFHRLASDDQRAIVAAAVSRAVSARALLEAVGRETVPRGLINALHARQILAFQDAGLTRQLETVWGQIRDSANDKRELLERHKALLTTERLAQANLSQGRALFDQVCALCHRLYGEGKTVGPDLTGSGRSNLDYLLENIVDPSALVPEDYRVSEVELNDDRSLTGVVDARAERTLELQTQNERLVLDRADIREIRQGTLSLMPEGLLDPFADDQIRDLIAYLMHPTQVPLPPSVPTK